LVDYSLFTYHSTDVHIFILVYVDDLIITGTHHCFINQLITSLKKDFSMKDLGSLNYFLGLKVDCDSTGIHLTQSKYIVDVLHWSKMAGAKPSSTPIASGSKLVASYGDPTEYHSIVGAPQYCTLTRPEISFTVNQLCQYMHSPTTSHWSFAKRVLRYLKGSLHHGLFFGKGSLQLNAFCDSDWAGSLDDRRSTTGYAVFLGSSLVSWSAKK
jgi:hypothetical protein